MSDPLPPRSGAGSGVARNRDRDPAGRARNARPRDALGRPLPRDPNAPPPAPDPRALPPADALREAQRLLDAGRPFEAHEVLEAVWKGTDIPAGERQLWRGLAQLAVGITHLRRGNPTGARSLLLRAADSLSSYAGSRPHGVNVDEVRTWADQAAASAATPQLVSTTPRLSEAWC